MSDGRSRDDQGRFAPTFTQQDVLLAIDYETQDEGVGTHLSTNEIADALHTHRGIAVTTEAVRQRLTDMAEEGLVSKKQFGASAVGWRAEVAPAVSNDTADTLDERRQASEDEFTTL